MKIATFNVNSVRSRLPVLARWIPMAQPDILALQETKVRDEEFPRQELATLGYHVEYRGEKAYNGVAVLSRRPPDEVAFGFDDSGPADPTRLAILRFGHLWLLNTYVPQGREITHEFYRYKLDWFRRMRELLERRFRPDRDLVLWVGDMNVAAEPADVHAPEEYREHVCFHEAVREAFRHCREWGFVDVFRQFHPEPGHYSFFDYRVPNAVRRKVGWRLDYLLATPPLARLARDAWIDLEPRMWEKPSDHTPVVGVFDLPS